MRLKLSSCYTDNLPALAIIGLKKMLREPVLEVNAVYVDGENLSKGESASQFLVHMIADNAERDDDLLTRLIEDEEVQFPRAA